MPSSMPTVTEAHPPRARPRVIDPDTVAILKSHRTARASVVFDLGTIAALVSGNEEVRPPPAGVVLPALPRGRCDLPRAAEIAQAKVTGNVTGAEVPPTIDLYSRHHTLGDVAARGQRATGPTESRRDMGRHRSRTLEQDQALTDSGPLAGRLSPISLHDTPQCHVLVRYSLDPLDLKCLEALDYCHGQ